MGMTRLFLSPRRCIMFLTVAGALGLVFLASKESQYLGDTWSLQPTPNTSKLSQPIDEVRHRRSRTNIRYDAELPINLNNTYNITRIIYNRVGKCGSRSLQYLTDILARWNNFNHMKSTEYDQKYLSEEEQLDFVNVIESQPVPFIYNRHVNFVDFGNFHREIPAYINLVRDPLERVVSFYYFKRYGDALEKKELDAELANDTFEECVISGKKECSAEATNRMVPYFCGHSEECRKPTRWALETAIRNIIDNYVFVGTLEEFDVSLYLLEYMMPQFFSGASDAYKLIIDRGHVQTFRSAYKEEPSDMAKEIMKERLALDYILYNFIKKRMGVLKKQFGLLPMQEYRQY
ncbi:uronyl 2-sulfotransferase-like [Glandiceps talaboti]